jgi:hypothetical protein
VYEWVSESAAHEFRYTIEQDGASSIQLKCVNLNDIPECPGGGYKTAPCYFIVPAKVTSAASFLSYLVGETFDLIIYPPGYPVAGDPGFDSSNDSWYGSSGVLAGIRYGGHANEITCDDSGLSWSKETNLEINTDGTATVSGVTSPATGVSCSSVGLSAADGYYTDGTDPAAAVWNGNDWILFGNTKPPSRKGKYIGEVINEMY